MSELHFIIQARSPLAINTRKPGGAQYQEVSHTIPGRVLRGMLAAALLQTCTDKLGENGHSNCPNPALCRAILGGEGVRFGDALPVDAGATVAHLLPATALSCKEKSGFIGNKGHGIFDSLIDRACWEMLASPALQYQPTCPTCRQRTQAVAGAYSIEEVKEQGYSIYHQSRAAHELLTRVAINRRRGVAEDELLYSVSAMSSYGDKTKKKKKEDGAETLAERFPALRFAGSLQLADDNLHEGLADLLTGVRHIGSGRSRGLGAVEITTTTPPAAKSLSERLSEFNQHFRQRWQQFASLSGSTSPPAARYFAVTLQSNAVLYSEDGWQPTLQLTPAALWRACGEVGDPPATLQLLRSYSTGEISGGWNELWGLRKASVQVVSAGSVYLFQADTEKAWEQRLQQLESNGIGALGTEGFGWVRICDEFHTIAGGKPV